MLKIKLTCLFLMLFIAVSGCEKISDPLRHPFSTDTEPLKVMTYNVYVGANMETLLGITNLVEVPTEVANVYDKAIASD